MSPWGHFSSKASMCMKASGKTKREMEGESSNGRMVQFMRDTGEIILLLAMEGSFMLTVMFLSAAGRRTGLRAKVLSSI